MKLFILTAFVIGFVAAQRRDPRCPTVDDSRNPVQLAHPTDCSRFLKCFNGQTLEITCPSGLHWNQRGNSCDTPFNARCTLNNNVMPVPRPQPQPQPRPLPPSAGNHIQHPDYLNCPQFDVANSIPTYYPYHLNCNQFYQCVNGRAVLLTCPAGHSWNLRHNFCDRVENVPCATPRRPL